MSRVLLCSALLVSLVASAALAADGEKKPPQLKPPAVKPKVPADAMPFQPPPQSQYHPTTPPYTLQAPPPFDPYAGQQIKVPPPKRLIYQAKNVPVVDLAKTVTQFLEGEAASQPSVAQRVVIVPNAVSNTLLVSAPPDKLDELAEMIKRLDAEPPMVTIDVLIVEVALDDKAGKNAEELCEKLAGKSLDAIAAEISKLGKLRMMVRPSVTTLSSQAAFVQIGERKPRITGRSSSSRGQVNSVSLENVGIILGVTPRITAEGVVTMEIDVERSYVGPEKEGTPIATSPEGEVVRTPAILTSQAQSTISAASDQTVFLGGQVSRIEGETPETRRLLMFVRPHVFRATEK